MTGKVVTVCPPTGGVGVPGSPGAPGILQDEEVHSQLYQVPLHRLSRHSAVHGVDLLGSLSVSDTAQHGYGAQTEWSHTTDEEGGSLFFVS